MDYKPVGVCAKNIHFEIVDGIVTQLDFTQGCNGNLKGLGSLAVGMKATDLIEKLGGTNCNGRGTSCPDQLAIALQQYLDKNPA